MINYLYWALFIGGMTMLFFAYRSYNNTQKLLDTGIKTTAKVIELITVNDSDGDTYKPVFEFTDQGHNLRVFRSSVSSNPPSYRVGDLVKIVYDPLRQEDVKTITYWGLYRTTIILLSLASPLLIIGGGYLMYTRG
tara:strand:+ start:2671 stop:3078 length:408 start_codon:yes stop_codon:yes gene_type:complete